MSDLAYSKPDLALRFLFTFVSYNFDRLLHLASQDIAALFYTKHELGLRLGYWFGFAAIAGAFGGLIAFGVQHIKFGPNSESDWKILFLIEVHRFYGLSLDSSV